MFFRDDETQVIALKIVKSIQSKLQPSEVSELLPLICGFCVSPSIPCRNVMYDILMWVYDNYRYRHTICKAPLFVGQIICIFMHRAYFYCPCFQRLLYVSVHVMTGTHYYLLISLFWLFIEKMRVKQLTLLCNKRKKACWKDWAMMICSAGMAVHNQ